MMPTSRSYSSQANGASSTSTNTTSSKSKPTLEIIPETRFIVFHGSEHEASSVKLQGVVRLTTPESMTICRPRVRLEGVRKIAWFYATGLGAGEMSEKRTFWHEEQKLGVESAHKIKAGVMEWPFEFELAPAMPESVEGLQESYIAYNLHASVSRPGWNARNLLAQEHIRLVRTLGPDSLGTTRSRVNSDIWANKISYSISIPSDAVVFGTSVTADVELSPLRKGLRMGKVELRMVETLVKRIQASDTPDVRFDRTKQDETEVAKLEMEFPEHAKVTYDDETAEDPVMADEMYKFKATLPLPKSLNRCRQDVDSHQISITHKFKLMVNIHNPEGHVSQLVCKLPVKLFISPNLPVDESNTVSGVTGLSDEALNNTNAAVVAPPQYGQHQLDQIFSDVDTAGYLSRPTSGPATPAGWMARSRRGSNENLTSLSSVVDLASVDSIASPATLANHGSATPAILRSRLAALQENGAAFSSSSSPRAAPAVSFALGPRAELPSASDSRISTSAPQSSYFFPHNHQSYQHTSAGHSPHNGSRSHTPPTNDSGDEATNYNMTDLTRVPSYGAALRTPGAVTPYTEGPPSYVEATSRPPSPGPSTSSPPTAATSLLNFSSTPPSSLSGPATPATQQSVSSILQRPSRVHVRSGLNTPPASGGQQQQLASVIEEDVRLRLLRAQM